MKHGHVTGTRRQHASASDWYRAIEAATLAQVEAAWPESNTALQEAPIDAPHAPGSTHQDIGPTQHAPRSTDNARI